MLLFVIARHCSSLKKQMNWRSPGLWEPKCSMAAPDRKSHLSLKLSLRLPGRESQMGSPPDSRLGLAGPLAACLNVEMAPGQLNCHHKQRTFVPLGTRQIGLNAWGDLISVHVHCCLSLLGFKKILAIRRCSSSFVDEPVAIPVLGQQSTRSTHSRRQTRGLDQLVRWCYTQIDLVLATSITGKKMGKGPRRSDMGQPNTLSLTQYRNCNKRPE